MIPELNRIDEQFHPYYIYHAVRKFIFMLNFPSNDGAPSELNNSLNLNKKQIPIIKILCSNSFREFNEFRFASQQPEKLQPLIGGNRDEPQEERPNINKTNWFSVGNSLRVYKLYLELDCDHNGTLSQKEMLQFNQSSLSNLCIKRIYQYKKTWDQEMDYKGFLNFVLAIESKKNRFASDNDNLSSLYYWWDILDLNENGRLTPLVIHTLFRSVQKKMGIFGIDPINSEDVLSEIIDMVNPKDIQKGITKQDLIRSKMWPTVIDILTDVKGFWEYDNRESMVADHGQ